MTQNPITQSELNKVLWDAAGSSRVTVDAGIYKDYALTMLFYKYLSDLSAREHDNLKAKFGDDEARIQSKMQQSRFFLPAGCSFDQVYQNLEKDNLGELINKALHQIEESNTSKLSGIFSVDFNSESILGKTEQRNKMLRHLMNDFNVLSLADSDDDIIGNAYMYLIEKFGADAGKKAGEFFTPKNISSLLARLAKPQTGDRICDPTVGSGGLLLLVAQEIKNTGSHDYALYGQESTGSTFQLCRMNMFLHGEDSAKIEWGDTLNNPLLLENDKLMKFDIVVANPPFSLKKWGAENANNDRFNRYFRGTPPKDKGDLAFISHMVETAKPKSGRVAVIVAHGVLFRSGAEGKIREHLLKENLIEAVIGLPAGLFQTTGIPIAILIMDRSRETGGKNENQKDILFIEASKEFTSGKAQNIMESKHIDKIFDAYNNRREIDKFSRLVSLQEIADNDYNLNITRYIDTFQEEETIDIAANLEQLRILEPQIVKLEKQMQVHLANLGIK
jgi:type I restriction enzyme M protein